MHATPSVAVQIKKVGLQHCTIVTLPLEHVLVVRARTIYRTA